MSSYLPKLLFLSLLSLTWGWFFSRVVYPASQHLPQGTVTYYTASRLLIEGQITPRIYDPAYFAALLPAHHPDIYNANPPTTTLLMLPFAFFSLPTANTLWLIVNVGLLLIGVGLLIYTFAPTYHYLNLIPFLFALLFRPVITNLQLGQAYIVTFFLITIVVISYQQAKPMRLGLTLGWAILLKTVGLPLIPLLVWQRQWAALWGVIITLSLIISLTLPLYGLTMWQVYLELLNTTVHSSVTCVTAYQTTASFLCRLFGSPTDTVWFNHPLFPFPILNTLTWSGLALATLSLALFATQRTASLMAMLVWAVLFAPLGEQYHHTLILIPLTWQYLQGLPAWSDKAIFSFILGLYSLPFNPNHEVYQHGAATFLAYPRLYGAGLLFIFIIYRHFYPTLPKGNTL